MIRGIIFRNMACIEYALGKYQFLTDWSQFYEGKEVSKKYGIPYSEMEKIVINEIKKIFI